MRSYTYRAHCASEDKPVTWTQNITLRDASTCEAPVPYTKLSDIVLVRSFSSPGKTRRASDGHRPATRQVLLEGNPGSSEVLTPVEVQTFMATRLGAPLELPD